MWAGATQPLSSSAAGAAQHGYPRDARDPARAARTRAGGRVGRIDVCAVQLGPAAQQPPPLRVAAAGGGFLLHRRLVVADGRAGARGGVGRRLAVGRRVVGRRDRRRPRGGRRGPREGARRRRRRDGVATHALEARFRRGDEKSHGRATRRGLLRRAGPDADARDVKGGSRPGDSSSGESRVRAGRRPHGHDVRGHGGRAGGGGGDADGSEIVRRVRKGG